MMEQSRLVVLNDKQWAVLGPLIDECQPRGETEPVALREEICVYWRKRPGVSGSSALPVHPKYV
jgi:hypothetical protein